MRASLFSLLAACAAPTPRADSAPVRDAQAPTEEAVTLTPGSVVVPHRDRIVFVDSATLGGVEPSALLDALEDVGAQTLYLFGATLSDAGSVDPSAVRAELGGEDGLAQWGRVARARGMDLVVDLELNHVDESSPLVEARPDWFHGFGEIGDYHDPRELVFFDIEGTRDFAQENPEVSAFLIGAATSFIDRAPIAGLGFQNARHVPLPFWAEVVWAAGDAAGARFRTLATWLSSNPKMLALVMAEGGFSELLDLPSHFALYETVCDRVRPERLASVLYADRRYLDPTRLVTWLDHPGIPSADERCAEDERAIRAALTLQHGLRGRPAITRRIAHCDNGEEQCSQGRTAHLRALFELRGTHPALFRGETRLIAAGRAGLLLLRIGRREVAVVVYNASDAEPLQVPVPLGISGRSLSHAYGTELSDGQLITAPGHAGIAVFDRPGSGALAWAEPTPRDIELELEGLPEGVERLTLVGDHEVFGDWQAEAGLKLRPKGEGRFRGAWVLPRGAAAELRVVATIDGEQRLEEHARYVFVPHQRGPLSLRWRWNEERGPHNSSRR